MLRAIRVGLVLSCIHTGIGAETVTLQKCQELRMRGDLAPAAACFRQALPGLPAQTQLDALYSLGIVLLELRKATEAEEIFQRGDRLCRSRSSVTFCGAFVAGLGAAHMLLGYYDLAESELRSARKEIVASNGPDSVLELDGSSILVQLLRERGEPARALPVARRALQIGVRHLPAADPVLIRLYTVVILTALDAGEISLARLHLAEATAAVELNQTPGSVPYLGLPLARAAVLRAGGDVAEAIRVCERALPDVESALGAGHAFYADYLRVLAQLYSQDNRHEDALRTVRRGLEIDERDLGKDNPRLTSTLGIYEKVLRRAKRKQEAKAVQQRVRLLSSALQSR